MSQILLGKYEELGSIRRQPRKAKWQGSKARSHKVRRKRSCLQMLRLVLTTPFSLLFIVKCCRKRSSNMNNSKPQYMSHVRDTNITLSLIV